MSDATYKVYCECRRCHVPAKDCGRCETPEDVKEFLRKLAARKGVGGEMSDPSPDVR